MKRITLVLILSLAIIFGVFLGLVYALVHGLPGIKDLENFSPSAVTRILSRDGRVLTELYVEKRIPIPLQEIPETLRQALLTMEDQHFFSHFGIDVKGILRAMLHNIRAVRYAEGGSTITQQLAKVLFLTPDKSLRRKMKEAILALMIEKNYTKDRILELYLNQIYLGSGAYGAEAAANIYFGKKSRDLNLEECALIAGLPRSPSRYSPFNNMERARERRDLVLKMMLQEGHITPDQHSHAAAKPINVIPRQENIHIAPYFIQLVTQELEKQFGQNMLYKGRMTVVTTLDSTIQENVDLVMEKGLASTEQQIKDAQTSPPDTPEEEGEEEEEPLQGACIVLDPGTGDILALYGGRDFTSSKFNRATQARRQPGSAFKPIIYAAALENGFTQADTIWDVPLSFRDPKSEKEWEPQNYSEKFHGEVTLRLGLEKSINIVAIRLLQQVGLTTTITTAQKMGLSLSPPADLTLALGSSEFTLLELAAAYGVFAAQGIRAEPRSILKVSDRHGRTLFEKSIHRQIAIPSTTAYLITDMLKGVVKSGTGRRASTIPYEIAGKTGTTNNYRDAWFIGYSAVYVTGVWVGYDQNQSLGEKMSGGRVALPLWIEIMSPILERQGFINFDIPRGIQFAEIGRKSGGLSTPQCPDKVRAAFLEGTDPKTPCSSSSRQPSRRSSPFTLSP